MRIGIDARFYGPFGKGLGRYTEKLIQSFEKFDEKNEYFIFLRKENFDYCKLNNPRFHKILADFRWYTLSEQLIMPLVFYRYKLDLVHFPHFNVPILYFRPFVVTIHDLIITHFPTQKASTLGPILYWLKQFGYKVVIRLATKRAKKVITVSKFSKKELIRYLNLNPQKVRVTYEATTCSQNKTMPFESLAAKFKIKKPYFLYVGNAYPHKNIEKLLLVFKRLKKIKSGRPFQLVLVGKNDYFFERIKREAGRLETVDVVFTGFVNDFELAGIYRNAFLYVFPSFYEGFGLPPLEAMSYGVPVVASNTSCLPEILGDGAVYFDPRHVNDIMAKIMSLVHNEKMRQEMIRKGVNQEAKYSWLKCARETLAVYQEAFELAQKKLK